MDRLLLPGSALGLFPSFLVFILIFVSFGFISGEPKIKLPEPELKGKLSLEETLLLRRSVRDYSDDSVSLKEVSQLLWAAQGITDPDGLRTAPSAGALYPLEVYVVSARVEGLSPGIYRYNPKGHELVRVKEGDLRSDLFRAALEQDCIREGAAVIVISAFYERTTWKYRERGIRYVHMEAGHAAQNIYLQATSLGLGTVTVGAFFDEEVKRILNMKKGETPLYLMPVGRR